VPSDSPPKPSLSLHAAATRALDEDEESTLGAPIAFPLPIELGLFHGVPAPQDTDSEKEDQADDDFALDTDNVVCLLPRPTNSGSIWELNPAGEESVREHYDTSDTLPPPDASQIQGTVEALLLAADRPLTVAQLNTHLGEPGTTAVRSALYNVQSRFRRPGGGIRLVEVAKGWQLRTDMRAARYVSSLRGQQPFKLSKPALETLSIVAYRQPVTRSEVEDLRGVDPGGILRMLAERGLIAVTGRKDEPGRPLLYGTTPEFLSLFGLRDLSDLPTLRDLRELQRDDARDGIGGTDDDIHATLNAAINPEVADAPTPLLHPVQEPLPLRPHDPID
jgi:segregation and condensation protein B